MLSGHIQMLKALGSGFVVLVFVAAAVLALVRRRHGKGMLLVAAGLALLAFAWIFETLTYVLPPADTFEGGLLHIGAFMGGAALGAPLIALGLLLLPGKR